MASIPNADIEQEWSPFYRRYKNGRIERIMPDDFIPPSPHPHNGAVCSKDVTIDAQIGLSARLYIPSKHLLAADAATRKLPLLIYFHGGGFIICTPFHPIYHPYLTKQVLEAGVIAVSVHYRRAPENPLPAAYDDCRAAIRWAGLHKSGSGPDPWLNRFADFGRVILAGDSAGANIVHNVAIGDADLGLGINGLILVHSYFWASSPIGGEAQHKDKEMVDSWWSAVCPSAMPDPGLDDPRLNPVADGAPSLAGLRGSRVLVCVAEKDIFIDRGRLYLEALRKSGWAGVADIHVTEDEEHVFHLMGLEREVSQAFVKHLADFINADVSTGII